MRCLLGLGSLTSFLGAKCWRSCLDLAAAALDSWARCLLFHSRNAKKPKQLSTTAHPPRVDMETPILNSWGGTDGWIGEVGRLTAVELALRQGSERAIVGRGRSGVQSVLFRRDGASVLLERVRLTLPIDYCGRLGKLCWKMRVRK